VPPWTSHAAADFNGSTVSQINLTLDSREEGFDANRMRALPLGGSDTMQAPSASHDTGTGAQTQVYLLGDPLLERGSSSPAGLEDAVAIV
jgi:hypothetical protein